MSQKVFLEGKIRTFGITPALLKNAVEPLMDDLKLTKPVMIEFQGKQSKRIAGQYCGIQHRKVVVERTGITMQRTVHVVKILRHWMFKKNRGEALRFALLQTIAHELRHAHQREIGKMTKAATSGKYWNRPIEKDAREYARSHANEACRAYVAG